MTLVVLVGLAAITGAGFVLERRGRITPLQLLLGVALGLIGAFVVLVERVDLIPDGPDDAFQRIFVIVVTVLVVLGTWWRIARA